MSIREIFKYAQKQNKEIDFEFTNLQGKIVKCKMLDAWYEMFTMDGKEFATVDQWESVVGNIFDFKILNTENE